MILDGHILHSCIQIEIGKLNFIKTVNIYKNISYEYTFSTWKPYMCCIYIACVSVLILYQWYLNIVCWQLVFVIIKFYCTVMYCITSFANGHCVVNCSIASSSSDVWPRKAAVTMVTCPTSSHISRANTLNVTS